MFITVFTPTYNRAYILPCLYESLCNQTCKDFEWLIIDDGSIDETESLVKSWIDENKIQIRYFYQENSGKSSAYNRAIEEADSFLFSCVDSDDYLLPNAIESINSVWRIQKDKGVIGLIVFRLYSDGTPITRIRNNNLEYSTLRDAYKKHGMCGDAWLIHRTELIKRFHFPVVQGEKFIPEGYLFNKLDQLGVLYVYKTGLYAGEYLEDGYSKNAARNIFQNYKGYVIHINTRIREIDENLWEKLKDSIRYDSVMIAHQENNIVKRAEIPFLSLIGFIPAYIFAIKRYKSYM